MLRCLIFCLAMLALTIGTNGCADHRPVGILVQCAPSPAPASAVLPVSLSTGDELGGLGLKVVTYNIWGLPSWMTCARRGRYPEIANELKRLDADIVLLQEAWTAKSRRSAPVGGPWSIARAAKQHSFFQQCGLLTLSKFPIVDGKFFPFSKGMIPDSFVNKGMLKVTVQLPDGTLLNIWNVHLQDGGPPFIRHSQIGEVIARVQAADDHQIADLVGGDFNVSPDSELWTDLENALGPSMDEIAGTGPFVTFDALSQKPGHDEKLDYIFLRQRIPQDLLASSRAVFEAPLRKRLSDHLGIQTVIHLKAASALAAGTATALAAPVSFQGPRQLVSRAEVPNR